MSASITSLFRQREAADEAEERMDQARVDYLALQGTDEERAAYNRWQRAMQDFREASFT